VRRFKTNVKWSGPRGKRGREEQPTAGEKIQNQCKMVWATGEEYEGGWKMEEQPTAGEKNQNQCKMVGTKGGVHGGMEEQPAAGEYIKDGL
jgi:hypothetical protein